MNSGMRSKHNSGVVAAQAAFDRVVSIVERREGGALWIRERGQQSWGLRRQWTNSTLETKDATSPGAVRS